MPQHPPEDSDALYQSLLRQGMSKDEAVRTAEQMSGARPTGAPKPTAAVSPGFADESRAEGERSWINEHVRQNYGGQLRDDSAVSDAMDFADKGLLKTGELRDVMDAEWADPDKYVKWQYKFKKRMANVTEQLAGGALVTFDNIQQAWWSLQVGEGMTEEEKKKAVVGKVGGVEFHARPLTKARLAAAWARLRPADPFDPKYEEKPPSQELDSSLESLDDTWALGELARSDGMTADEAYAKANGESWVDREPRYWERLMNRTDKITSEEMLEQVLGGKEKTDAFLASHRTLGPAVAGGALFLNDVLNDPTIIVPTVGFDRAVQAGIAKIPGVKAAAKKVVESPVGRVARTNILKPQSEVADLLAAQGKLHKTRERIVQDLALDKRNPDLMRKLVQIDNRIAESDFGLEAIKGNVPTLTEPKNPVRKDPKSVYIGGMSTEKARRRAYAVQHASFDEVDEAVKHAGYKNTVGFEKAIGKANESIRSGNMSQKDIDVLNSYERLPQNVKTHLDIRGFSRERIFRRNALEAQPLELRPYTEVDALRVQRQQAMLGADDAQYAGDGAMRFALGAKAEDIMVPAFNVPDFSNLGHGNYSKFRDSLGIEVAEDGRKILTQDGQRVFSSADQTKMFFPGRVSGLVPGSWHYNAGKMLRSFEEKVAKGIDIARWGRQPGSALPREVYQVYRAAHGNYLSHTVAEEDWFGHVFTGQKWAKHNSDGKLVATSEGKASIESVFNMLDAENDIDLVTKMEKASAPEKETYFKMRKYFDQMADRLGLDKGLRIRHYAPHILPLKDIAAGARVPEFLGLPPSAMVEFAHLNPRLGAEGYERDLLGALQVYSRGANRKIFMEPAYEKLLSIRDIYKEAGTTGQAFGKAMGSKSAGTIPGYIDDLVRDAKGMPGNLDQKITQTLHELGEPNFHTLPAHTQAAMTLTSLFYTSLLAGNPTYFSQNLLTAIANTASKHGPLSVIHGFAKLLAPGTKGKQIREIAAKSGALGNARRHMDDFGRVTGFSKYVEVISNKGTKWGAIEASENLNRGFAFTAALSDMINRSGLSWDEIVARKLHNTMVADAVQATEFTQHVYAKLGKSPRMSQTFTKGATQAVTQFLSFPFKQGEFLLESARRDPSSLSRFIMMSGWMTRVAGLAGMDVSKAVGLGTADPIGDQQRPLTSPAMDTMIDFVNVLMAHNGDDVEKMARANEAFVRDGASVIPFGNQIIKAAKNAGRLESGLIKGPSGELIREMEGSDILPAILGQKSINDAFERKRHEQMMANAKYKMWSATKALDGIMKKVFDGDTPGANEDILAFYNEHGRLFSDQAPKAWVESRLLSRRMRDLTGYIKNLTPDQQRSLMRQIAASKDAPQRARDELMEGMQ